MAIARVGSVAAGEVRHRGDGMVAALHHSHAGLHRVAAAQKPPHLRRANRASSPRPHPDGQPREPRLMNPLLAIIPEEVLTRVQGKTVIEAGVATGPSYMVFAGNTFDPPVELEKGLEWIIHTMDSFKRAHLMLSDHTVLFFSFNRFDRYETTPQKSPIRPQITISGHKVEPFGIKRKPDGS